MFYYPSLVTNLEEPNYYIRDIAICRRPDFRHGGLRRLECLSDLRHQKTDPGNPSGISAPTTSAAADRPAARRSLTAGTRSSVIPISRRACSMPGASMTWPRRPGSRPPRFGTREGPWRGRIFSRTGWSFPNDFKLTTELAVISDYNFQEQYFEQEWDQFKDETNDVEIKQQRNNWSWAAYGQMRLNDFYTETQWMPRLDHFTMGQSLLDDRLTWFEHSNVGYAQLAIQQPPTNAADLASFSYLPWEPHSAPTVPGFSPTGDREATRQEIGSALRRQRREIRSVYAWAKWPIGDRSSTATT